MPAKRPVHPPNPLRAKTVFAGKPRSHNDHSHSNIRPAEIGQRP
jgi:hypothetical protein